MREIKPSLRSQAEQRARYTKLIELHRDELRAHCRRILRSPHDAEDALQDALLRAWRSLPQFEGRGPMRSWLYRIATNASLDQLRQRRESPTFKEPPDVVELQDHFERRETRRRLFAVAGTLPPKQRSAFVLREVFGLSARETAEMLGSSVASVNSNLQRARVALRLELEAPG